MAADPARFRPVAERLVAQARRAGQPEALALALRALAWAERARLDDRSAIRLLDEACRIARRHRLDSVLAELLMSHAAVSQELGRMTAARRDLDAAEPLVTGTLATELSFHRAVLLQNIGQLADSAALYHRVLSDTAASARRLVLCANNLALIESQQGRHGLALRRLEEVLPAAGNVGPALTAMVVQSRAWVTVQSGRFAEGLGLFEEAEQAYRDAELPLGEHYIEYADALMELRLLPEATNAARRAVEEFSAVNVPLMAAEAQLRVAQLATLSGECAEADAASAAAVAAFRRQARAAWRARAVVVMAEAHFRCGTASPGEMAHARAAAELLDSLGMRSAAVHGFLVSGRMAASLGRRRQAVAVLTRAGSLALRAPVLVRLRGRVSWALAAALRHRDNEALTHCRRGLSDLALHRGSLPSVELRALASGHGAELGLIGLGIVIRDGSPSRVLNWMERSRAAALLAIEPPDFDEIRPDLAALRAIHTQIRDAKPQHARTTALARTRIEREAIESRIRRTTWRARSVAGTAAAPVTVAGLRDHLAGRVLVAYGMLGEDLIAVVIERRRSRLAVLGPLGPVREQLRMLLFALRRMTQPRPQAQLAAARASADVRVRRLTELLMQPLKVPADAEVVVIPLPGLQGIPWSALHDGPVCLAPSATFWVLSSLAARARQAHKPGRGSPSDDRANGSVVLVAGPDLPGAVAEVESLAQIYPLAAHMAPPASTVDRVADALAGANLAHLACHGVLRADNPMFSSLLLSDGPLTVQELYARGLAPHRLILAACESGSMVHYAGDEVLGFVSALLARGTAGVIASTAAVLDVEAVDFMTAVHRKLASGATLAHALHQARASQDISDPANYVCWCIFNAHGAA
ncbi:MAG: CHAT domain-containing protein [Micromonosporaceae bacterium]